MDYKKSYDYTISNCKNCIKVPIPGTTEHKLKPKLFLKCSVQELHIDLVKEPNDGGCAAARKNGKIVVSATVPFYIILPQVHKVSDKYKTIQEKEY